MKYLKIFFYLFLSQIYILGVFWEDIETQYVIEAEKNLCGEFTRGNADIPNWLPNNWQAVVTNPELQEKFLWDVVCQTLWAEKCCRSQWFRYAGVPIWVEFISPQRKAAEFLAGKNIIQAKSLDPRGYNLDSEISRKEVMKIILKLSGEEVQDQCKNIFWDVINDWACKYIEAALKFDYIVWDGPFRPEETVTKTEALKLIFKARNIQKAYTTDFWEEDYISTALYYSYIDEKYSNYTQSATRGWIFSVASKTFEEFSNY